MAKYAFKKGWNMVPKNKADELKEKIKTICGISSDAAFYARMAGSPEPTHSQYLEITAAFKECGVKDPWGDE
jgi:hypothetical protein